MEISSEFWNIKKREGLKEISIRFMTQVEKGESQKNT